MLSWRVPQHLQSAPKNYLEVHQASATPCSIIERVHQKVKFGSNITDDAEILLRAGLPEHRAPTSVRPGMLFAPGWRYGLIHVESTRGRNELVVPTTMYVPASGSFT